MLNLFWFPEINLFWHPYLCALCEMYPPMCLEITKLIELQQHLSIFVPGNNPLFPNLLLNAKCPYQSERQQKQETSTVRPLRQTALCRIDGMGWVE